ncbi:Uncharacterised protein [Mycobacteroides abscessus subsp. abscessus]|nr:Uncharacterised protein [Mycobacteroides abscessus subsp. abscessus]
MGSPSPASFAALVSVWIGLRSPETTANAAPPARCGSSSSASPMRPRMAKRSVIRAISPSGPDTSTATSMTRPTVVSRTSPARATMVSSVSWSGMEPTVSMVWSRWTRSSRPSTTGMPSSVVAAPIVAKTLGQQAPTSVSGTAKPKGCAGVTAWR